MSEADQRTNVDDTDRRIIEFLQGDGRATWQQVAAAVGASDTTVARRTQRLIDSGVLRIVGTLDPLLGGLGFTVLVRIQSAPGTINQVASDLASRSKVRFLAIVTGSADIVAEVVVTSQQDLGELLLDDIDAIPGVSATTTSTVTKPFKATYSAYGSPNEPPTGDAARHVVDDVDLAIADVLGQDGRASFSRIAAETGITESMARRRTESLLERNLLIVSTMADSAVMGFNAEALVWVRIDHGRLEAAATALSRRSEVRYLSAAAGDADLVMEVQLRDQRDLYRFTTQVLGQLDGVRHSELNLELRVIKRAWVHL